MTQLLILEVVIVFSFIVTGLFMFIPPKEELVHKIFFSLAIALGLLVTVIDATSLPSNLTMQIAAAWLGLLPSAAGVILAVAKGKPNWIAKILVMLTTVYGALGYLFFL